MARHGAPEIFEPFYFYRVRSNVFSFHGTIQKGAKWIVSENANNKGGFRILKCTFGPVNELSKVIKEYSLHLVFCRRCLCMCMQ